MIYGRILRTAVLWAVGANLWGQQVGGPLLGYVWDARLHQLRPLLGTPGASTSGPALETGQALEAAVWGPKQNFAVILTGESLTGESRVAALLRPEAPADIRMLAGVHPGADRVELSPAGSAAAFYFPDEKLIQIVTGLPGSPSEPIDVSLLPLRNPMAGFTVSDDGAILLCRETAGDDTSIPAAAVVLSPAGDLNRIVLSGAVTAAAFLEGTHDALLAGGQELVLVRDVVAGVLKPLGKRDFAPTMLAFAPGGDRAILADERTGWIAVESLDAPGSAPILLKCHCRPTGLFRLKGEAVWRLNESSRAGMRLLDLAGGQARLLTVPPPVESR